MAGLPHWGREEYEREAFYDVDVQIYDEKLFAGIFEHPVDPEDYRNINVYPETYRLDREFFEHFRNSKILYSKLNQKSEIAKTMLDKSYLQIKSMDSLVRYCINQYE